MKKCPCRTARPSGPSTRRGLTATELRAGRRVVGEPALQWPPWPSVPACFHTCLTSRDFLVLVCLHNLEKETKTEDSLQRWAEFILRVVAFVWEEKR